MRYLFILMLVFSPLSHATEAFGKVHDMVGVAYVSDALEKHQPLHVGEVIYVGQTISTQEKAELHIVSRDGGLIALRPNSVFRVDAYRIENTPAAKVHMSLLQGSIRSVSGWVPKRHPESYQVEALSSTIGVRGTDHEVTIVHDGPEAGVHNTVYQGATVMRNSLGEVHVPVGHFAHASHDSSTAPTILHAMPDFHAEKAFYKIEHRFEQHKLHLEQDLERIYEEWLLEWDKLRAELEKVWF